SFSLEQILAIDSIATVFIQLLCDLAKLVRVDGEKIKFQLLIYYLGHSALPDNWTNYQRMVSSLATIMEIDFNLVIRPFDYRYDWPSILAHFPELIDVVAMDIHPIAGAILSRSLIDLEEIILRDPEAPMARILGLTTLQLCASWPEGLQALLKTKAKSLIDLVGDSPYHRTPVSRASWYNWAESVDILMKADCQWDAYRWFRPFFNDMNLKNLSSEVVSVIASNLAERRRNLLRLAEQELRIPRHADPSYVPDCIAADLCRDLDLAGVSFHPCLRVSQSYETIYHIPLCPIKVFPAFFKEGFQDCAAHDSTGLTPAMIWRHYNWERQDTLSAFLWMCEQGLLDQKAEDPLRLGLNVHATGWHSIASMFGATYIMSLAYYDPQPPMGWEIMKRFSRVEMRDECVCWCSIDGKGCSPLMSLWKAHAARGMNLEYGGCYSLISRQIRHLLFHNDSMFSMRENGPSSLLLEFLRFITFEALDMKHTCCVLSRVDLSKRSCHIVTEDIEYAYCKEKIVLAHRDQRGVKRTLADDLEQENAQTLELLMKDFTEKLKTMEPSPRALETFLWGYWRRRISELYSVNTELVNEMGRELRNVQTHILSERVLKLLGEDFGLLRYNTREASMGNDDDDDDASSIEDIDLPPHCPICDGEDSDSDDIDEGDESDDYEDSEDE
ncbi:uncharacterized protein F4807DRAFT_21982, partial [Annulohypoxylon truncatum]|uniref:uncharacterized protein n=1 Tax=Annulohypoxylon truncatum TaxID=327061 RepID=UPI002007FD1F